MQHTFVELFLRLFVPSLSWLIPFEKVCINVLTNEFFIFHHQEIDWRGVALTSGPLQNSSQVAGRLGLVFAQEAGITGHASP